MLKRVGRMSYTRYSATKYYLFINCYTSFHTNITRNCFISESFSLFSSLLTNYPS